MSWWTLEMLTIDARLLLGEEVPDRLPRAEERAAQVDGEHLVEVGARELVRRARDLDTRVVDEHVDAAELLDRVGDHAHDLVLVRHVGADEHVADTLLAHLRHAGVHLLLGVSTASPGSRR